MFTYILDFLLENAQGIGKAFGDILGVVTTRGGVRQNRLHAIVTSNDDEAFATLHIEYIVIYGTFCKVRGHRDKIQLDVS